MRNGRRRGRDRQRETVERETYTRVCKGEEGWGKGAEGGRERKPGAGGGGEQGRGCRNGSLNFSNN